MQAIDHKKLTSDHLLHLVIRLTMSYFHFPKIFYKKYENILKIPE